LFSPVHCLPLADLASSTVLCPAKQNLFNMEGQQRMALWAAEEEIGPDEIDIQDSLALAQAQQALYAQQMFVEDGAGVPGINEATLLAMQQQLAQQAAFATIPDVVKRVSVNQTYL
jgi:hypothetical protein